MPREIWNEGRVVGYSAYELYVKQHLSEDPDTPPATEREWLASSLAMGSSMILKVPNVNQGEDSHTFLDVYFPTNTRLAAANTIVATYFDGDATFSGNWATKVTDYGQLISNTSSSSPSGNVGPTGTLPTQTLADWTDTKKKQLADYMRIYDGLVLQPGNWVNNSSKPPQKDFQANLSSTYPRVRLHIRGPITTNPLILLTGFTIRSVLAGTVGQDTVTESTAPQDGDFLGPAVFPWAAKIVFSVPSSYITYFASGAYKRALKSPTAEASSATTKVIKDEAVIDMQASKPETFYNSYSSYYSRYTTDSTNPRYGYNVASFSTLGDAPKDGEAVLTVFQKKAIYPPALYGTFVGENGQHYLNPLDIVAPGSIKMFNEQNAQALKDYQDTFPGTTSMNKKSDGTIQILDVNNELIDIAGLEIKSLANSGTSYKRLGETATTAPKVLKIKTGRRSAYALLMSQNISENRNTDPTQLTITDKPSNTLALTKTNSDDNLNWATLLSALTENKAVDMMGTRIKSAKYSLIENSGYLEFGPENNKIRFYISKTEPNPANIPTGSIGMGWGFSDDSGSPTPTPDPSGGVESASFGAVQVGSNSIVADEPSDVFTLVGGSNITISADTTNKKITITSTTDVNAIKKRTYVMIGDSYGAGQNMSDPSQNWMNKLKDYLSNDPNYVTSYTKATSGSGFIGQRNSNNVPTFEEQAITLSNTMTVTQRTSVTDVVVLGGWNDGACTQTTTGTKTKLNDFGTAVSAFNTTIRSLFPNAKIWLGYISYCDPARYSGGSAWNANRGAGEYAQYAGIYGWAYMANIQYSMHLYTCYTSDGLHPNEFGQRRIAKYAATALMGGAIDVRHGPDNPTWTMASGVTASPPSESQPVMITTTLDNDVTSFWMRVILFDFSPKFNMMHDNPNWRTLLTIDLNSECTVRGQTGSAAQWFQPAIINHEVNGSTVWTGVTVGFRIEKNELQFKVHNLVKDGTLGWPEPKFQNVSRLYIDGSIIYSGALPSRWT